MTTEVKQNQNLVPQIEYLTKEYLALQVRFRQLLRRVQLVACGACTMCLVAFLMGANYLAAPSPIRTTKLEIVDGAGSVKATLSAEQANGMGELIFWDPKSKPAVRVGYYEGNGPMLAVISDAKGTGKDVHFESRYRWDGMATYLNQQAFLSLGDAVSTGDFPTLTLYNASPFGQALNLTATTHTTEMTFFDSHGGKAVSVSTPY